MQKLLFSEECIHNLFKIQKSWTILLFKKNYKKIFFVHRARQKGYRIHCGRWLVEGNPQVILFDVGSAGYKMNEFKQELYDKSGIGIPHEDIETNDVAIFG